MTIHSDPISLLNLELTALLSIAVTRPVIQPPDRYRYRSAIPKIQLVRTK